MFFQVHGNVEQWRSMSSPYRFSLNNIGFTSQSSHVCNYVPFHILDGLGHGPYLSVPWFGRMVLLMTKVGVALSLLCLVL